MSAAHADAAVLADRARTARAIRATCLDLWPGALDCEAAEARELAARLVELGGAVPS